jgi:hypothetical protein
MKNPGIPKDLWSRLDGRLWHATDLPGLRGTIADGFIHVSRADRYQNSFCRLNGSLSLFDFGPAASDQSEFELSNWVGWFGFQQNARCSIWLEIDRERSAARLMNPAAVLSAWRSALDREKFAGRFFVGVEACHDGPIASELIVSGLVIARENLGHFETLDGPIDGWPTAVEAFESRLPPHVRGLADLAEAIARVNPAATK